MCATVKTEGANSEGVIMPFGGVAAGIVCYLDKGMTVFDYNYFDKHTVIKSDRAIPAGEATITINFSYLGGKGEVGKGANFIVLVNDEKVAEGLMEANVARRFSIDTFGIGEDSGQPVTPNYKAPFKFTGKIEKVVIRSQVAVPSTS